MKRQALKGHPLVPVFFDLHDRFVLVVGGGSAGLLKVKALVEAGATVRLVSPALSPELAALVQAHPGLITLHLRSFKKSDLGRTWRLPFLAAPWTPRPALAYLCTDNDALNARVSRLCKRLGIPACDASDPARGDFISPGILREGPFTLALSSGGQDLPGARRIRSALEDPFRALAQDNSAKTKD